LRGDLFKDGRSHIRYSLNKRGFMKAFLVTLLFSLAAQAQTTPLALSCVVPVESGAPVITVAIEALEEAQGDFMTLIINTPSSELVYFNQLEKGAFRAGLTAGQLVTLVVKEGVKLENGAVVGAGFLVLSKDETGYTGFASLNDTFFPLQCK